MIKFTDADAAIRTALNANDEYCQFVQPGCAKGYIIIQVDNGHIVLYHNVNDSFSAYLLPGELQSYPNNIHDMCRIANTIQAYATSDYQANSRAQRNP